MVVPPVGLACVPMTTPFEISDRLTDAYADLDPLKATVHGVTGREHLPTDFSPEGSAARAELYRSTRGELVPHLDHPEPTQAFAARVIVGWLDTMLTEFEHKKWSWDLNHVYSPFQQARDVFDVMATESPDDWDAIRARLEAFPVMLDGYSESLAVGVAGGNVAARRQVESVIEQADELAADDSRFVAFIPAAAAAGADPDQVGIAVDTARAACARFARWLRSDLLPFARESDAAGRERYALGVDEFVGMDLDLTETYEWGWTEVHRLIEEMEATAGDVDDSLSLPEVVELLETDPARSAATREEFVEFISAIQEQAISQLDGVHFDVVPEIRKVTVNMAPPGGALGAWYVGPSEDWLRPGSIWYAPGERERLPYWQEVSTAYHEGFPGHHLQVGVAMLERENLSRFHRMYVWYSGAGEGWALYAERLMDELGFFEKPEYRLGLLASQLFRAVRVVLDIGCQLEMTVPEAAPLHPGAKWSYPVGVDYMEKVGLQPRDVAESEVKRYLGWLGQAISYKVGEREILAIREEATTKDGGSFDRKDFHKRMLQAGAIRLDHLREVML